MPQLGRIIGSPYRRLKFSRIPLSLIYVIEGRRILVHAVASNYESLATLLNRLRQ